MKELIEAFPQNIVDALKIAQSSSFQSPKNEIHNVLICGLGGSGIGAKLVANWIQDEIKVPVAISNEYTLPAFVNKNTLVIGSSYSGNTEETIMSIHEAHGRGCHILGVCSGGQLEAFCKENNYDCVIVPGGNPPRSALAFSLVQLLNMFSQLGLISDQSLKEIEASATLIEGDKEYIHSEAKALADFLYGKVGILYAETKYEGVIVRARQQFNENSKYLAWHHTIPEMNHNELVGWGGGDERFAPVFFYTGDLNPRNQRRMDITLEAVQKKCGKVFRVEPKGNSFIERSIFAINIVDWASYYLCNLNGADIIDIAIIDYLKGEMAKF